MQQSELAGAVAEAVGQALGEMSVGVAVTVLATTNAIARQPGVDRVQLFRDVLDNLPDIDGAARNVVDVVREAIAAALRDAEAAAG